MKKLITIVLTVILLISVTPIYANTQPNFDIDYSQAMINAAVQGDVETGVVAAELRNEKISLLGLSEYYHVIDFTEFYLLAKVITKEYGSSWLPLDSKMIVGEVLLNRVYGPEFKDTLYDCVYQPGQYACVNTLSFKTMAPYEDCCIAAFRLLNGERILNNSTAVFQSESPLGSKTIIILIDPTGYYNPTYIGQSNYPNLYN